MLLLMRRLAVWCRRQLLTVKKRVYTICWTWWSSSTVRSFAWWVRSVILCFHAFREGLKFWKKSYKANFKSFFCQNCKASVEQQVHSYHARAGSVGLPSPSSNFSTTQYDLGIHVARGPPFKKAERELIWTVGYSPEVDWRIVATFVTMQTLWQGRGSGLCTSISRQPTIHLLLKRQFYVLMNSCKMHNYRSFVVTKKKSSEVRPREMCFV